MSFVFSRDDAVSNTVSRPVAGKLALAPHPMQKWRQLHVNQKCRCDMWLSPEVEITLVPHWDRPLGNSHPPVANQRSIRRLVVQACHNQVFGSQVITVRPKTASNWGFMSCELCLVFVSDSSFLSSLDISQSDYGRFVRILQVMSFSHSSRYEHKRS